MVSIKVTVSVEFLEEYCYIFLVLNVSYIKSKLSFIGIETVSVPMISNEVVII